MINGFRGCFESNATVFALRFFLGNLKVAYFVLVCVFLPKTKHFLRKEACEYKRNFETVLQIFPPKLKSCFNHVCYSSSTCFYFLAFFARCFWKKHEFFLCFLIKHAPSRKYATHFFFPKKHAQNMRYDFWKNMR